MMVGTHLGADTGVDIDITPGAISDYDWSLDSSLNLPSNVASYFQSASPDVHAAVAAEGQKIASSQQITSTDDPRLAQAKQQAFLSIFCGIFPSGCPSSYAYGSGAVYLPPTPTSILSSPIFWLVAAGGVVGAFFLLKSKKPAPKEAQK